MGHSALLYKDCMLLFGGGESQDSPKNCLWKYSFFDQTWTQVATLPGSNPPCKIHHCCAGLGPSYKSSTSSPCSSFESKQTLMEGKLRPFKNKCFPAPFTFLGSEGAIELETFSPDKCYENGVQRHSLEVDSSKEVGKDAQWIGSCLTFENRAVRTQWSYTEEDLLNEEDEDITQHLPDLLLVLGGRPCSQHSLISMWQMTFCP